MVDRDEHQPEDRALIDISQTSARNASAGNTSGLPFGLDIPMGTPLIEAEHTFELIALDHIALRVSDVRRAEAFYHEFFEMDVVARARRGASGWEIMPGDLDWAEGIRTGYYPELVVLRNGPINLLLLNAGGAATFSEPRLAHVGLRVTSETLAALRGTVLIRSYPVTQDDLHAFRFHDPYGITWHLSDTDSPHQ